MRGCGVRALVVEARACFRWSIGNLGLRVWAKLRDVGHVTVHVQRLQGSLGREEGWVDVWMHLELV